MKLTNFFLEDNLHQDFKILAAREGRSVKDILTELIEDYLKTHLEGNPQHLITQFSNNEDFMGFPAMSIKIENKRKYFKKMPEDLKQELLYHIQEWQGVFKKNGLLY